MLLERLTVSGLLSFGPARDRPPANQPERADWAERVGQVESARGACFAKGCANVTYLRQ